MTSAFDPWLGRVEEAHDRISARQARQMAATLGVEIAAVDGAMLPPLWHWMGWTPETPMSGLGPDGHPARGGFLPPVPLERRMWAGGRLRFHAPLVIGERIERRSEILKVAEKTGSTGQMVFVTVRHDVVGAAGPAISEEQDIVYVAMPDRFVPPPPVAAPEDPLWSEPVAVDTVRLFRFSALTFNGHRIHYDLPYARGVEKYPGLVVHGPLQAMLLMEAARRRNPGHVPSGFRFRGVRPLFAHEDLRLEGQAAADGAGALVTVNGDGLVCMQAEIGWREMA
jgi:3-methylfumaryl-CoA hydratase